jgi:hypothetical protein
MTALKFGKYPHNSTENIKIMLVMSEGPSLALFSIYATIFKDSILKDNIKVKYLNDSDQSFTIFKPLKEKSAFTSRFK